MLILARHLDERLIIDGGRIVIQVLEILPDRVRLGRDGAAGLPGGPRGEPRAAAGRREAGGGAGTMSDRWATDGWTTESLAMLVRDMRTVQRAWRRIRRTGRRPDIRMAEEVALRLERVVDFALRQVAGRPRPFDREPRPAPAGDGDGLSLP